MPEIENKPEHIKKLLENNINVEIDVWHINGNFFLGHDTNQYIIEINFLKNNLLWCHAKNLDAFDKMLENKINCFWHQNDSYTLTSSGFIWAYPGVETTDRTIIVDLESDWKKKTRKCYGVCVDYLD